eukprot:gb/GECG01004250.1/.p1 GENE.gb/GECG01004250.1/~~gb/GECG01004250.1/.p1  ORF type:complete len:108 (+),score=12.41 gb/GECG01004250.1/:1-324(+)
MHFRLSAVPHEETTPSSANCIATTKSNASSEAEKISSEGNHTSIARRHEIAFFRDAFQLIDSAPFVVSSEQQEHPYSHVTADDISNTARILSINDSVVQRESSMLSI